jgi:integrase/recombinase XerC
MRQAELIGLKCVDVDFYKKQVKVLGKRNKERIIPVTSELMEKTEQYLAFRKQLGLVSEFLFTNEKGKPLYPKLVYNLVHHYLQMC